MKLVYAAVSAAIVAIVIGTAAFWVLTAPSRASCTTIELSKEATLKRGVWCLRSALHGGTCRFKAGL